MPWFRQERPAPDPDRPIGDRSFRGAADVGARWDAILLWFMRALALAWIAKGLLAWAVILGVEPAAAPFEARASGFQATTIYFAIIDLVAAVGLWLASTWGGVMWLLAVMSYLILAAFFPLIVPSGLLLTTAFAILMLAYLVVSWLASPE